MRNDPRALVELPHVLRLANEKSSLLPVGLGMLNQLARVICRKEDLVCERPELVTELLHRTERDQLSPSEDHHLIADRLDLIEVVGRQHDGLAAGHLHGSGLG